MKINDNTTSLKEFIQENQYLLSSMAVLVAITSFMANLSPHWLAQTLTFISILGVITIWFELNSLIPKEGTSRLFIFRYVILSGLVGFIFYWLLAFKQFWNIFLFVPIFLLLLFIIVDTIKQLKEIEFVQKIFGIGTDKNKWQKLLNIASNIFLFIFLIYLLRFSTLISPGFNFILDIIRLNFN